MYLVNAKTQLTLKIRYLRPPTASSPITSIGSFHDKLNMRPISSKAVVTVFPLLCVVASVMAQTSGLKPLVNKGCFSSSGSMSDLGSFTYQTAGYCQDQCVKQQKPVMATSKGSNCWCGDLLPVSNSKVSDSECNSKCDGYDKDTCKFICCCSSSFVADGVVGGGPDTWNVQLTGLDNNVGSEQGTSSDSTSNSSPKSGSNTNSNSNTNAKAAAAPSSSSPSSQPTPTQNKPPSVVTKSSTIVVTAPGQTEAKETVITTTQTPASSGPNKAGIAAGVVVGIVALSAIAGGIIFFLRNRKKRAIEEEYRRNIAASYGQKPPTSSAGSTSDSRLEPSVLMQRRQSDGSIADNQDYSRRILKVGLCAVHVN